MPRLFVYDGRTFPDPDSRLSVEDVRRQLADYFPELANADTREECSATMKTTGACRSDLPPEARG
jgi:PRTRC genetic system protein C